MEEKEFYAICPTKGCRTISGFSLPEEVISKNEIYFCGECRKESKLNKWKLSNHSAMISQVTWRKYILKYGITKKLKKKEMEDAVKKMLAFEGIKPKKRLLREIIEEIKR